MLDSLLSRRSALAAIAGLSLVRPAVAQQLQTHMPRGVPPKPKGPLVFLDYDKEELDASYDQTLWAPNQEEIRKRNVQKDLVTRARLGQPRRLAYGDGEMEKLDLYTARRRGAPINIFVHGGAWRVGSAAVSAYLAETFVDAGAHFIAIDFNNAIEVNGDLMKMADQVRRSVVWVYRNAEKFGGNRDQLFLSGHSSGGHLAAAALTTDWSRDFGLPRNIIKGGLCCSGIYDLYPVSLSARSNYVKLPPPVIEALSPIRHVRNLNAPLVVAYGTLETPEFQRQNREFAAAVNAAGKPVTLLVGEGYNHFEMQETMGNPYGLVGRAVLQQMRLR